MSQWPHAPVHKLGEAGAYMVTASTYGKKHHFRSTALLDFLNDSLLSLALQYDWALQAWAVFSNHYHFVAVSPADAGTLRQFIRHLHSITAREVNARTGAAGRKIWHEYWDTHLTFERSYLARLNYVHQNPVRHGLVPVACQYPWCSAGWFEQQAVPSFYNTVSSFKTDALRVPDGFDVVWDL